MVRLGCAFLLIFIFTQATSFPSLKTALRLGTELQPHRQKKPMVVIIDPFNHYSEFLDHIRNDRDEEREREEYEEDDPKEEAKSLFYNYLRSSPEGNFEVEKQKSFLRSALRARCNEVRTCAKKCPPKKKSCPASCKEVFDSLDLCGPPKKKPKSIKVTYEYDCGDKDECGGSYGKTMPPRWKL